MTVSDVVKTTCFLADMNDFAAFNQIYGETFTHCPARSCVAVREIPKGVLCEDVYKRQLHFRWPSACFYVFAD